MIYEIIQGNVVIVARQFNPSIFSQSWLIRNNILLDAEFPPRWVYSPLLVDIPSTGFHLSILPEKLQFAPVPASEASQELLLSKVGMIVKTLPHTPFIAAGLNIVWQVCHETKSVAEMTRWAFFNGDLPLFRQFDAEDAHFGAYMSRDVMGCRLKLDVTPVTIIREGINEGRLQFSFNFHRDMSEEHRIERLLDLLGKWREAWKLARTILESFEVKGG